MMVFRPILLQLDSGCDGLILYPRTKAPLWQELQQVTGQALRGQILVIERELPGAGSLSDVQIREISNTVTA
jgi:hypothetical protein